MKIDEKYVKQIIDLTQKTELAIRKIGYNEYNIHLLTNEKNSLLDNLSELSKAKQNLLTQISNQYGEGYLDPETWELTPIQNQNN